jgi:hypothetical protein
MMDWSKAIPKPGRYEPDGRTPAESMAAIRQSAVEIGYGYDANGQPRFIQVGDESGIVGFRQEDLAAIADGLFVHNHPPYPFPAGDPRRRAGSFSSWDLVFMWENDLAKIIAVTAERTYFLRRLAGGLYLDPGEIQAEYRTHLDAVRARLDAGARAGLSAPIEAMAQGHGADEVMNVLAASYDYRWTEVLP